MGQYIMICRTSGTAILPGAVEQAAAVGLSASDCGWRAVSADAPEAALALYLAGFGPIDGSEHWDRLVARMAYAADRYAF